MVVNAEKSKSIPTVSDFYELYANRQGVPGMIVYTGGELHAGTGVEIIVPEIKFEAPNARPKVNTEKSHYIVYPLS